MAAAAALAFLLGGVVVYESVRQARPAPRPPVSSSAPSTASPDAADANLTPQPTDVAIDPWQSDELRDFHAVVQWESWMPESGTNQGASS